MLEATVDYAKGLVRAAAEKGVSLRLAGSVAVVTRCPERYEWRRRQDWAPGDVDFVCAREEAGELRALFRELKYENDERLLIATEGRRWTLYVRDGQRLIDVFFDRLEFCHPLDLRGRIALDPETLTLADLLLSKLQYVAPRTNDIEDIISLLKTYPLGNHDEGTINLNRIGDVLEDSWGFYYTAHLNFGRVSAHLEQGASGGGATVGEVREKVEEVSSVVESRPKGLQWKFRALIGPRLKWYNDVEEAQTF